MQRKTLRRLTELSEGDVLATGAVVTGPVEFEMSKAHIEYLVVPVRYRSGAEGVEAHQTDVAIEVRTDR